MFRLVHDWSSRLMVLSCVVCLPVCAWGAEELERVSYNNPGLVVDLGVGLWAWPLPMDYDRDGELDLVVSCPDVPYNGVYWFENPGGAAMPIFKPAVRLGPAVRNIQISYVGDDIRLLAPGVEYRGFREKTWDDKHDLSVPAKIDPQYERTRANQWKSVDYDGDGDQDLIVGLGVWDDYGWDDAWDENGNWTNGPLHGFVYFMENQSPKAHGPRPVGTDTAPPIYADPVKLTTRDGTPIDVYGMPSPNLADFDGDGDLDLVCGEFLDGFTYFENIGSRKEPQFASGRRLPVRMDLQMITPTAVDWDNDGDVDLICGDEDGRVALIEHTGEFREGVPVFARPVYFQQAAADVKFGALVTPVSVDWDGDGDEDLVCGNTAGYLGLIENLGGGKEPVWNRPRRFPIPIGSFLGTFRAQAGKKGSIQGPCEAKWGYTATCVADWNHNGDWEVIVNDIWGRVSLARVIRAGDQRGALIPEPMMIQWGGPPSKPEWTWWTPNPGELATQWRTTPCVLDWNGDGLNDLVMLDHEGYLAFYERARRAKDDDRRAGGVNRRAGGVNPPMGAGQHRPTERIQTQTDRAVDTPRSPGKLVLLPPERVFKIEGPCEFDGKHRPVGEKADGLLRLNANRAGGSGRRKLCFADWDGDGRLDLLVNSVNVNWLQNVRTDDDGFTWFRDRGPLDERTLAGHTTSPTVVDWDNNGIPDLLVGAEDGYVYYKKNPRAELLGAVKLIDLDGDADREVVVDREPGQYLGHPTTVLLEDGRTMLCVYPEGHGRGAIRYQRSSDGGLTWSGPLKTPASWATSKETPTLHRVIDAEGTKRLIMWSGLYPARLAVSEDDGETWSELAPAGDWGGVVVMSSVAPLRTGPGHYIALFHDDGRFMQAVPRQSDPVTFTLYKTLSTDGGLTWSQPEGYFATSAMHCCEPGLIRSPDTNQLAVLLRENSRRENPQIIFSDDEGQTWSDPRPLPDSLNGDRHTGKYGPDGRLFISFRSRSPTGKQSPYEGDWVGWIGTYDDLVNGDPGQYYVRLKDNTKGYDCAYPGVEVLPDGTFVTTTYGHWDAGEEPYVLSVRFTLDELDRRANE